MYVQAVLIFLESQQEAVRYFYDHADEVNGITGLVLHIIKPREPRAGWEVNQVINSPRFPGLQFQDIPCLWVEATGGHFPVRLPGDVQAVQAVLFRLLDSFKDAISTTSQLFFIGIGAIVYTKFLALAGTAELFVDLSRAKPAA